MNVIEASKKILEDIITWRRELHQMPELGYELTNTSGFITKKLEEMGIEYRVLAKTGICAVIYGRNKDITVALRADMDALPIKEETELPFASNNGCMHACGHDAHVAMLLGTAKLLQENREMLRGNVKLIFQPAEENVGGAQQMIKEGCLENPKVNTIIGLHIGKLTEEVNNGMIGIRSGAMMAAVDDFSVRIIGKGGHGAAPHECIDPITIASEVICSIQKIVSREIAPTNPAVVTIGKIVGGTAFNIIPDEISFEGCVRTLTSEDRVFVEKRIREMLCYITKANRGDYEITYTNKYPVLINDDAITSLMESSAGKVVGGDRVVNIKKPIMASEDMAYYLNEVPGTFIYLGSNNAEKNIIYPHHHPRFDVDEDVLWIGPAVFLQCIMDYFENL